MRQQLLRAALIQTGSIMRCTGTGWENAPSAPPYSHPPSHGLLGLLCVWALLRDQGETKAMCTAPELSSLDALSLVADSTHGPPACCALHHLFSHAVCHYVEHSSCTLLTPTG